MEKIVKVGTSTWFSKKSAAIADAKIRLRKEYPRAIITSVATIDDSMGYWAASAVGEIAKDGRILKKSIIKDIYTTELYHNISTAIEGKSVVKYKIVFKDFAKDQRKMVFTGTGNIEWKGIESYINEYNQNTYNRFIQGEKVEKFYVNIHAYNKDIQKTNTIIGGFILLKDGSWITLEPSPWGFSKTTFNSMSIHTLPKGDDIKAGFNVKLSLPGKPDVFTDTVSASNVDLYNGGLKINIDAASNAKQAYMALHPNVRADDINVFSIGKSDGKERALAGKKVVQPGNDLKEEKDAPVETQTVETNDGNWFYTQAHGGSIDKAREAAEADAKKRLLKYYPNATNITVSSYLCDGFDDIGWYASATGHIPKNPVTTPKEEPTEVVKEGAKKVSVSKANFFSYGYINSPYATPHDASHAARLDARNRLIAKYPSVRNIKIRSNGSLFTPSDGSIFTSPGGYYQAWAEGEIDY